MGLYKGKQSSAAWAEPDHADLESNAQVAGITEYWCTACHTNARTECSWLLQGSRSRARGEALAEIGFKFGEALYECGSGSCTC